MFDDIDLEASGFPEEVCRGFDLSYFISENFSRLVKDNQIVKRMDGKPLKKQIIGNRNYFSFHDGISGLDLCDDTSDTDHPKFCKHQQGFYFIKKN